MAKHKVVSYTVAVTPPGDAVRVDIETELKKPYQFELRPDVNYPTVQDIESKLSAALAHCVSTYEKVDVSVFADRNYVTINVKDHINTRFTGVAV